MGLDSTARRWRAQYLGRAAVDGAIRIVCAAFAGLILLLWLDQSFALGRGARWLLVAGIAAAALAGLHLLLLRPWLGFRWETVLDRAAAVHPELKDYLKTAWELARGGAVPNTSDQLRRAHIERANELLGRVPDVPLFSWKPSRAARGSALAAMLGGFTLPWLAGSPSWERVLAPWHDVPLERFVDIAPGDAGVEWGGAVKITARFSAVLPAGRDKRELVLRVDGGGGWKPARWDSFTQSGADYSIEELGSPLRYRLAWRDLESKVYSLTPLSSPQLDSLQAVIHGAEPVAAPLTAAQPLSVLRGTMITITGRPSQPLSSAKLKLSTLPAPVAMKALPSGEFAATFVAQEDASLNFDLETPDGRTARDPTTYGLKALPDMPPKIELLSPVEPLAASPRDAVPLSYTASDDGGLTRISLLIRARGMPGRELLLAAPYGRRELTGEYRWELSGLPLGKLEFQLKAVDNASRPQTGLSAVGVLELVDFAAGHAQTQARWAKADESVKALAAGEERTRAALNRGDEAALARELSELPQSWADGAASFSQWARAMEKDPYANPGLAQAARDVARALEQARSKELPAAIKAAQAGDGPQARSRHDGLSARVAQAQRLLTEGGKLQGLQDFYAEAGRMSQSGAELRSKLDALAQTKSASADPQALADLKAGLEKLQRQISDLQKTMQALPKVDADSPEAKSRQTYELPLDEARQQTDELARALARGDYAAAAKIAQRLSESLAKIQRALGDAASDAAGMGKAREGSERMAKAQAMLSEVVEEQTKVLEKTQALEQKRLESKVAAQKELLAELARRQAALVSSATAAGAAFPQDALGMMRAISGELDARRVVNSVSWLKGAAGRMRMETRNPAFAFEAGAAEEDAIRQKLEQGAPAPEESPGPESAAAAAAQQRVRQKTARLQNELEKIDADTGGIPSEALGKVEDAQGEQSAAEAALDRGQSTAARGREETALSLLSSGGESLSQAMSGAQSAQAGMSKLPGSGAFRIISGGPGGQGGGAALNFVPLPSDQEYAPPREIRDELKKSLQESRPSSYDGVIKEYFKRISQ